MSFEKLFPFIMTFRPGHRLARHLARSYAKTGAKALMRIDTHTRRM
jgi:hypothetical protein